MACLLLIFCFTGQSTSSDITAIFYVVIGSKRETKRSNGACSCTGSAPFLVMISSYACPALGQVTTACVSDWLSSVVARVKDLASPTSTTVQGGRNSILLMVNETGLDSQSTDSTREIVPTKVHDVDISTRCTKHVEKHSDTVRHDNRGALFQKSPVCKGKRLSLHLNLKVAPTTPSADHGHLSARTKTT